ncbi:uncharacterized protein PV07_11393 [Cladophialophora immunda]|uniref:Uncharacterized protein n=1 Tax=Cladophialophora immunda TaxID=569365 RepID=A0A0D2BVS0_9EURO|nr:uncharacterized protein PV07_11393 [Cladophialophora immunda]KIW23173.1 hypothetical protein PV07_11393 [Cladophialophora immunda]
MDLAIDFEAARLANMQEKQKLLESLNLLTSNVKPGDLDARETKKPPAKRRRGATSPSPALKPPSRTSARIAAAGGHVSYNEDTKGPVDIDKAMDDRSSRGTRTRNTRKARTSRRDHHSDATQRASSIPKPLSPLLPTDLPSLIQYYNSWTPSAGPPTQDPETQGYHFASHPAFRPNKSPLDILQEGAFGGSFFAPWHSRTLGLTLADDHLATLPAGWLATLQPAEKYITAARYEATLNRHGRACGQTLAQWEAAGWLDFRHDPRGWFEWYIRFWLGRRLDDGEDERQVGRWLRCVGPRGRWRRMLLKKYVEMGVRSVFDDGGGDDDDPGAGDDQHESTVSPVIHQTCLQWGYQVTQEDLDDAWRERRGGAG